MKKKLIQLLIISALFLQFINLKAQPYVIDNEEIDGLKNAKLYVVMATEETDINNEYIDVFKENWKYCPFEIIEPKDILKYMKKGAYFMNMSVSFFSSTSTYCLSTRSCLNYELSIYTPKTSFLNKLNRNSSRIPNMGLDEIANKVAYIKLKPDDAKRFTYSEPLEGDFMGKGFILTSGSGYLKNYLQFLQTSLLEENFLNEKYDYCDEKEIFKLKSTILYVPSELLRKYSEDSKKPEENFYKMSEVVKEYKYPGKLEVISTEQINEMILTSEENFYYLSLYTSYNNEIVTRNIVTITNSISGEIIYKETMSFGKTFSPKLFKNLSKLLIEGN